MTSTTQKAAVSSAADIQSTRLMTLRARLRAVFFANNDRANLQRDALLAFSVRVFSAAILYLSQIVLARWMGTFEYGIYVSVWTLVLVLGGLSNLGLATTMIRLLPEYRETGKLDQLRGLLRYSRLLAVAVSTAIALLALVALQIFGASISKPYILPLFLALACLPMITLSDIHDGIGRGGGWMGAALVPPYVLRPLLVLLAMIVGHEMGWPMSAETAVGAAIVATWTATMLQFALLHRRIAAEIPKGPRVADKSLWLATSLPLLAISGSELLIQNTDLLVIGRFLSPEQCAIYFAAAKTMALVMFVHYAVGSAMAKRFSALNARGDQVALKAFARDAVHWTFWPSLAAAIALLALGKPLLWLFGPNFTAGYPVMAILVVGFLGRAAMGPSEFLLNMLGEQKACAAVIASMALLNIGLQFAWVPQYGIIGAAMGTSTVMILGALLNTIVADKRLGIQIAIWHNLRRP